MINTTDKKARLEQMAKDIFTVSSSTPRWHAAFRLGITEGLILALGLITNQVNYANVGIIGGFIASYGIDKSFSRRFRIQFACFFVMIVLVWLGSLTFEKSAGNHLYQSLFIIVSFTILTFVSLAFAMGPPGAYILCLTAGMATVLPFERDYILWVGISGLIAITVTFFYSFFVKLQHQEDDFVVTREAVALYCTQVAEGDIAAAREARNIAMTALEHNSSVLETTKRQLRSNPKRREYFRLNFVLQEAFMDVFFHEIGMKKLDSDELHYVADQVAVLEPRNIDPTSDNYPTVSKITSSFRSFISTKSRWYDRFLTSLRRYSPARRTAVRVACATIITIILTYGDHDIHSYWAPATTVVILHTGPDTSYNTVLRALQRTIGCIVGIAFGLAIIKYNPQGAWLILIYTLLLMLTELTSARNYALSTAFVTPSVMMTSSLGFTGGHGWEVMFQRSKDTAIGCAVAIVVALISRRLLQKSSLWEQLNDLISRAHNLISTVVVPDNTGEEELSTPLAVTPLFQAKSAELLHLRLQLNDTVALMPDGWKDEGTQKAVQTAKNFADLALVSHTASKEKTDSGLTLREYSDVLLLRYEGQFVAEKLVEMRELAAH